VIIGIIFLAVGLIQSAWAVWAIRTDASNDHISLIETGILKATKTEPLPKSRIGLAFDRVLAWVILLLGLCFTVTGLLILSLEFR
jgi:hypothetical protein